GEVSLALRQGVDKTPCRCRSASDFCTFEVRHTVNELSELAGLLKSLDSETRVVTESTGNYHAPVAWLLHDAGLYVSVVNAMLVHDYGNNSLRQAKTDKKDAVKLANYGLDHWLTLPRYAPEEDTRLMLKTCYRQYQQYSKVQTMLKNNWSDTLKPHTQGDIIKHRKGAADGTKIHGRI